MLELKKCKMCPHECGVDRTNGEVGRCKAISKIVIAYANLHFWEEPCISGTNGSGTIFFSNCNLSCIFCQNHSISQNKKGKVLSVNELADLFLVFQKNGAHNINLVSPSIYVYQIIESIKIAKNKGLVIPIVYNTNAYEKVETLKLLEGYIDVYIPDLKYFDNKLAIRYSKVDKYFEIATLAIKEMLRQVGKSVLDENLILKKGIIVRHLILPGQASDTKMILKWIKSEFNQDVLVSVMAQYFPAYKAKNDEYINRKISIEEYTEVEDYLYEIGLDNGYIQELGEHEEEYVPNFDEKWIE